MHAGDEIQIQKVKRMHVKAALRRPVLGSNLGIGDMQVPGELLCDTYSTAVSLFVCIDKKSSRSSI